MPNDVGITFPAKLDGRNCIYIPKPYREFINLDDGDFVEVTIKVTKKAKHRRTEKERSSEKPASGQRKTAKQSAANQEDNETDVEQPHKRRKITRLPTPAEHKKGGQSRALQSDTAQNI